MRIKKFNESEEYITSEGEKMAIEMGLSGFEIESIESIDDIFRIYGRISGELCYFEVEGDISRVIKN